ncbi:MAG TPA: lactate utilization protein [Roseiflexaceae bacterium]|nr:lactate utilization protein [Roseiflexaceae bacterium]
MTTNRDRMLARIRAGLERTRPALEAEAASAPHVPPPFVHPAETDDLAQQFAAELARLQAHPHLCADEEAALDVIQQLLERHTARAVIAWDLDEVGLPGLRALLDARGVTVHDAALGDVSQRAARLQAMEPAPVCISGADALIAESGTVVLRAGPGRPRLASLLAPAYIAVARRGQLVRGLGEALARLRERYGAAVFEDASALTLITGPSRTADIELTLTLGVHGPREVHVVIIQV